MFGGQVICTCLLVYYVMFALLFEYVHFYLKMSDGKQKISNKYSLLYLYILMPRIFNYVTKTCLFPRNHFDLQDEQIYSHSIFIYQKLTFLLRIACQKCTFL